MLNSHSRSLTIRLGKFSSGSKAKVLKGEFKRLPDPGRNQFRMHSSMASMMGKVGTAAGSKEERERAMVIAAHLRTI